MFSLVGNTGPGLQERSCCEYEVRGVCWNGLCNSVGFYNTLIHMSGALLKHYEWLICLALTVFYNNICFSLCLKMHCFINLRAVT